MVRYEIYNGVSEKNCYLGTEYWRKQYPEVYIRKSSEIGL
jgi:hypothetical protein